MAIPTIFQRIKESVKVRKKAKKEIEEIITLNNSKDDDEVGKVNLATSYRFDRDSSIRLLDEGAIFYEGGQYVRYFIKKGVVQKFYDELDDDFVGYINLAHFDVFAFPIFLGTWTKDDLRIVDLEDGRQALEVVPRFNEDLYLVKDLFAQEIPLSVSIEAYFDYDWDMTQKLDFPVVQGMQMDGFSVVGNPANTSSAYVLSSKEEGENMDLSKIKAILENSEETKAEEQKEELDSAEVEEETKAELETEENLETENSEEENSTENLENTEETEENTSENLESEEDEEEKAILQLVTELVEENKALKAELEALKAEKAKQTQKTESVISKLESIVNSGTQKKESSKKNDSVWG
jgi:hypothetical protein